MLKTHKNKSLYTVRDWTEITGGGRPVFLGVGLQVPAQAFWGRSWGIVHGFGGRLPVFVHMFEKNSYLIKHLIERFSHVQAFLRPLTQHCGWRKPEHSHAAKSFNLIQHKQYLISDRQYLFTVQNVSK